jgi:hypothetical protein
VIYNLCDWLRSQTLSQVDFILDLGGLTDQRILNG